MPRSSRSSAASPMRGWALALLLAGDAACSMPNPAFGAEESSGDGGPVTTDTGTSTSASATTVGSTMDPSMSGDATSEASTSVDPDPETGSTTEDSNLCCGADDCGQQVLDCVCGLMESCCDEEWGEFCPDIATACGGTCRGEEASCCTPRPDRPACEGVALIPGFCLLNPTCCLMEWTPRCVAEYDAETRSCSLGGCDTATSVPGCSDPDIMECVCEERPQCCAEQWDATCVEAGVGC